MSAADWNELDGYEALVSELRANAPVAPESLRQRVLEGAPAPRRRRSRRQRLLLVVVPVAVVLSVGAALVHGFVSTRSPRAEFAALRPVVHAAAAGKAIGKTSSFGPAHTKARVVGKSETNTSALANPYQAKNTLGVQDYAMAAAPSALKGSLDQRQAITIPKHRLVHAVATLQVGVRRSELSARTNQASQIVGSFGGYAQSVRFQASRQGYGEAFLDLRVPVQKANAAMAKLSTLGRLLSQEVSTQDLQSKLTSQNSGIGTLRRAIAVYVETLQSTTLPASQRALIEIRLNNARHALSQLQRARTGTLASGATADISLLLTTQNHAIVAHHHHKQGRFGRLLGSAGNFLGLEGIIVLYALIVLFPIVLVAALVWWIVRERRRREDRLLASA